MSDQTKHLIATFKDYSTAQMAARELEETGVPKASIQIDSQTMTAGAGSAGFEAGTPHEEHGFSAWWNSLFGSETDVDERRGYEGALSGGSTILRATVPAAQASAAAAVLNRHGATDVDSESRTETSATAGKAGAIDVIKEELLVAKRAVQSGGVRIYSHMVSTPVEEQVRLREEHVNVQRRPVDREMSPSEVSQLRDQTIEVTEMAEEAVVSKRARVLEEVTVGKDATERTETVRDNVRHTEVKVEQLGKEAISESMRPAYDYGTRMAGDHRYSGRSWADVENDLRSDYETSYPGSTWEKAKEAVRSGWEKMTGRR